MRAHRPCKSGTSFGPALIHNYRKTISSGGYPLLVVLSIMLLLFLSPTSAQAQGRLTTSPDVMSLGSVSVGSSRSGVVSIKNTGNQTLTVSGESLSGSGFSASGLKLPLTMTVGESVSFTVIFAPTASGAVTAQLQLISNTPSSPSTVHLYGTGLGGSTSGSGSSGSSATPAYLSANSLTAQFGTVAVGTENTQIIQLTNTGGQSLTINSVTPKGTGFSVSGFTKPITLGTGASTQITVGFLPESTGSFSGSVVVASTASDSTTTIVLSGTGGSSSRILNVNPSSVSFGNVNVNGSATQQVSVTNGGNSSLTISTASITGTGLSATGVSNNTTLTSGQTAMVVVEFLPKAAGSITGAITIKSNASNATVTVPVTGTGVATAGLSVALQWAASTSSGVVGYNVYRSTVSGGPYAKETGSPTASTSYLDSSVSAGAEYYYVVTAVNSGGEESGYSNQVAVTVP
jgi:hypothetical protein